MTLGLSSKNDAMSPPTKFEKKFGIKRKLDKESEDVVSKQKKWDGSSKYIKPPKPDEIRKFREIQFLHHSNLFRLQTNELLSTIEVKQKTKVEMNKWLLNFTTFLKGIPKSKHYELSNEKWLEEGISLPLKMFPDWPKLSGTFCFVPPNEVSMVGSFPLGLATTHSSEIDVALVLPKEFMQSNDVFSGKWLFRRALYLAWVGKALRGNSELAARISWTHHCGEPLRPTLQVVPEGKFGKSWKINLFPVPPRGYVKMGLISPTRNNVSPSWFFGREDTQKKAPPTPHHNWLCGVDVMMVHHHTFIASCLKHPNWIQGVKLLKIWMCQRNLNQGEGSISTHLMTLLVIHLSKMHKISPQMSPYQVFRTTLLYLSQTDWRTDGVTLYENTESVTDRNLILPTLKELHDVYRVVFVDSAGFFNLAGNVLASTYLELQQEAKIGLEILELSSGSSFDSLFIQRAEFHLAFDQTVQIRLKKKDLSRILKTKAKNSEGAIADRLGDVRSSAFDTVILMLSQGLGDRVELLAVCRGKTASWDYDEDAPDLNTSLTLGLSLNQRTFAGLLTKGPSADSPEASEFREFWGEVSSLRRFKDSTFHEAVLWMDTSDPVGERRLIVGKIIKYVMNHHFGVPESKILYVAGQLETILRMPYHYPADATFKYGTGEEVSTQSILAFDSLSRKLRSLQMPLKISHIQSSSDVLKHSCVYPPMAVAMPKPVMSNNPQNSSLYEKLFKDASSTCPLYTESIEVQIFLEISGKWPDDLLAIKAIKVEFMCTMAGILREEGITAVVFPTHLFVIWEGYVFRVKICYRREIYLLRMPDHAEGEAEADDDQSSEYDTEASIQLEKEIEILPRMTSSLSSLQSEFPSFSGGIRMVRRWVSSQLLLPHFPHVVVDLLVAHLYLSPSPHKPPNSPHVALLRFIRLMAQTDWRSTPIFVNFREQFSVNDESELMNRFTKDRESWPHLFVCSPCELRPLVGAADPTPEDLNKRFKLASCWSRESPSLPILSRMKLVAGVALETYAKNVWNKNFDFTVLFRPPLKDYDVLIFLNENVISRRMERIGNKDPVSLKHYEHVMGEKLPPVDFDPVQIYLKELRASFSSHALFFNDEHGGSVIGVAWKPSVYEEKEVKIGSVEGHKLIGIKEVKQVVNLHGILDEIRILGEGIVKEIKLKS